VSLADATFISFAIVTLFGCKGPDDHEHGTVDPMLVQQARLCEEMCFEPFCDPSLEPAPEVEDECNMYCADTVDAARGDDCTDRYQSFLECLDGLSCEDHYLWLQMDANAPCAAEEAQLTTDCPSVEVRHASG